jgi:hypothetical protein
LSLRFEGLAASGRPYDPGADMAERYPEWVVRHKRIAPIPEVLCVRRKVVLVDTEGDRSARRCALAHAVAHIDLDHLPDSGRTGRKYEREADELAARRLIPLDRLADVLTWALGPDEVADELDVTEHMVRVRVRTLAMQDKAWISAYVQNREGAA